MDQQIGVDVYVREAVSSDSGLSDIFLRNSGVTSVTRFHPGYEASEVFEVVGRGSASHVMFSQH